jgi:LSD1 subclass zinc finger protein
MVRALQRIRLQTEQIDFADRETVIGESMMYHGGDILYTLRDVPGIWHPECLIELSETVTCSGCSQVLRYPRRAALLTIRCPRCSTERRIETSYL